MTTCTCSCPYGSELQVDWLQLTSYRSYPALEWAPTPGTNILVGNNGAGKTNVLEAISYAATLKSFRVAADSDLINDEAHEAVIRIGVSDESRETLIEILLSRAARRRVQLDKKAVRRSSELHHVFRVVTFLPDDLDLVKRGPGQRRDLLDEMAAQLWPAAGLDQAEYVRALKQRNAYLRAPIRDETTLSVWDSRLAQSGGRVLARRQRAMGVLQPHLESAYRDIARAEQRATFTYQPSWGVAELGELSAADYAENLASSLAGSRRVDQERRLTTTGPHRDEPGFALDGVDTRTHGSQGEQRSMALAVRLASHRALTDSLSVRPVLLLDDVFSELDPARSHALAHSLPAGTQTLITTARPEDVPLAGTRWTVDKDLVEDG